MSDKPDVFFSAREVPFGHGLMLQDLLEMTAYFDLMAEAPVEEMAGAAKAYRAKLTVAAKKCTKQFVHQNYPGAAAIIVAPGDETNAAKNSLDEIIKKGSK